tara:strand:+ start:75 stop:1376 length:1302 start_codon:yes stop_codon:yes gene_type:complete
MKVSQRVPILALVALLCASAIAGDSAPDLPDLAKIRSEAELDALIASSEEAPLKQALSDHADAILAASKRHPHVAAVIRTIESSPGSYEKINTTPASLKQAAGGELAIFDTLTSVTTRIKGGGAHDRRKESEDPYDAAFVEHIGQITTLETLYLEARNIEDSWVIPILNLKNLSKLSIIGFARLGDDALAHLQHLSTACPKLTELELAYFGKATDAGLEQLAGLKNLQKFTFRGSRIRGHAFAKFDGWTSLTNINFHSNQLDDQGLGHVCESFPNLEFIKLWHSKLLTDASAENLKKLTRLKGIEISCSNATANLFKHIEDIPLEYAAFNYGVNSPAAQVVENIKSVPTLRRLSIQAELFTDAELRILTEVTQVEQLSLSSLPLTDEHIGILSNFDHLKELELIERRKEHLYSDATKAKVNAALPNLAVKFVP